MVLNSINSNMMAINGVTMMLYNDSKSIESNQIPSHRFEQGDIESIDHDAL